MRSIVCNQTNGLYVIKQMLACNQSIALHGIIPRGITRITYGFADYIHALRRDYMPFGAEWINKKTTLPDGFFIWLGNKNL